MLSFIEAQRKVLEHAKPLGVEECLLAASVGRVPSEDIVASATLPPFDNSAMDGYALCSTDTVRATPQQPVTLPLVGESVAGAPFTAALPSGAAIKIMTGAALPSGADTVVALEEARLRDGHVMILHEAPRHRHVRSAGEDVAQGNIVLRRGTRIRWEHLGLLASLGFAKLNVFRAPHVAVLATGSELVPVDAPLGAGQIRNANSLLLTTLLRQLRMPFYDFGIVPDDRAQLQDRLREALAADLLLISGGVSVGEHDLVKQVLQELELETIFWRVNMKPGKPLLFGRIGKTWIFGLPGNPVSCVVGFIAFIAPFIRKMLGDHSPGPSTVRAVMAAAWSAREAKTHLVTAHLAAGDRLLTVTPTSQQGSGMLTSLAQSNALMLVPETMQQLHVGDVVEVIPLDL